jgi:uncharacterized protein (TIGR00369 family)
VTTEISPPIGQVALSQTDKIRDIQAGCDADPISNFLGIRIEQVGDGQAKVSIKLTPNVLTPQVEGAGQQHVNGLAITSMAGYAAGIVAYEVGEPTTTSIRSQDVHYTHLAQPRSFPVTAEAKCVHRGKHMIVTEVVVTDGGGYPIERMSTTWGVVPLPNQAATSP